MTEVIGTVTALGMAAAVARFCYFVGNVTGRVRDELRFRRSDVSDLDRRFARILGERSPL